MNLVNKNELEESKLLTLFLNYQKKPYFEYIDKNDKLTEILFEKVKNLKSNSDFFILEDNDYTAFFNLRKSDWDSKHFQRKIGKIDFFISTSSQATDNVLRLSTKKLENFDLIITRLSTNDASIINLQKYGFLIMDTNVTYSFNFRQKITNMIPNPNIQIRSIEKDDLERVVNIAYSAFGDYRVGNDHFHADPYLTSDKSTEVYSKWIENVVKEGHHPIFVAEIEGKVIGFSYCSVDETAKDLDCSVGHLPLSAVDPQFHKRGVYSSFIWYTQNWLKNKVNYYEISTQIGNHAVQKAWINNGFKIIRSEYTFHYHNPRKF